GQPVSGKTGTSEANRSSSFLGFTDKYAAAVYAFNDGTNTSELCSGPLRQCGNGNLFGGDEPAMTWFSAMNPISDIYGPVGLPEPDPAYQRGTGGSGTPDVEGMSQSAATSLLTNAGFAVDSQLVSDSDRPYGTAVGPSGGTGVPASQGALPVSAGTGAGAGRGGGGPRGPRPAPHHHRSAPLTDSAAGRLTGWTVDPAPAPGPPPPARRQSSPGPAWPGPSTAPAGSATPSLCAGTLSRCSRPERSRRPSCMALAC